MTDPSAPDSSPASRNTFAHHLGMKGFLLMEGLLKLVGMKTLYRLGRAAGAVAWHLLPQRRNIVERNLRIVLDPALRGKELQKLSRENFKRTIANFLCSAKTATLTDEQLKHCVTVGGHEQYGTLTPNKDNAILLFHALSGSQHAYGYNPEVPGIGSLWKPENHEGWWNSIIGPDKPLDTNRFCIICANYLGGCYGTTGPATACPADGQPYGSRFPHVEAADQARLQALLLDSLGIERVHLMGPSVGGLIALSFACQFPERVRSFISIGSGYRASIEHRLSLFEQILAIELDPDFQGGDYYRGPAPKKGLAFARIIGHKSFVYQEGLEQRARKEVGGNYGLLTWMTPTRSTQSYMLHQGTKFAERFDANAYIRIADMWAEFDIRDHTPDGTFQTALEGFRRAGIPALIFSIDTDCCFRPAEQQDFAAQLEAAHIPTEFHTIASTKGHDSFLLEPELYAEPIRRILAARKPKGTA